MEFIIKNYFTYLMMNQNNSVIYTGMTNDIERRVLQHKEKMIKGFTKKYNVNKLVYFEEFGHPNEAIEREKQIKGWNKIKKLNLIKSKNPELKDLSEEWTFSMF